MSMEQFLIDVAKATGLPGFGSRALPGGGDLNVREDLCLKMLANIAYDPQFLAWHGGTLAPAGPVSDASPAELASVAGLREAHGGALTAAQWRKAAYVLARAGASRTSPAHTSRTSRPSPAWRRRPQTASPPTRPIGEYASGAALEDPEGTLDSQFLYAFWRLCEQRIGAVEMALSSRSAHAAAARAGMSADVRVAG
jgi:hypothetical protein